METDIFSTTASAALEFSPKELDSFERDGYAIVRNVADAELRQRMLNVTLEGLHRHIEPLEYEADLHYPGAPVSTSELGGKTVRRLKQAHSRDFVFTQWIQNPAIVNRLKQILGPKIVCPLSHHNCIMTKEPKFSSDTGWHQDIRYWSFERPELVSVWLALGNETEQNGCLQLVPGSHCTPFERSRFDDEIFFRTDLAENQAVLSKKILAELNPGDVLFFHCKTLHAATRNRTDNTKYSLVLTYRSLDNPPKEESRSVVLPELLIH